MTRTAFISGHRDVSDAEFLTHYVPKIDNAVSFNHLIVVGDYKGVDHMAQKYLDSIGYDNVIVYHMFKSPRNHVSRYATRGGYTSDEERDLAMTKESDYDIAWVRAGKEKSGTARNIERRDQIRNSSEYLKTFDQLLNIAKTLNYTF